MKSTGIVRDIDKVGRVVIPKELRNTLQIADNDPIEFFTDGDNIIIRPYKPACIFCNSAKDVITYQEKRICRSCLEKLKKL